LIHTELPFTVTVSLNYRYPVPFPSGLENAIRYIPSLFQSCMRLRLLDR